MKQIEKLKVPLEGSQALHIKINELVDFANSLREEKEELTLIGKMYSRDVYYDSNDTKAIAQLKKDLYPKLLEAGIYPQPPEDLKQSLQEEGK